MVEISDDDFERMVSGVFDALPDDMARGVENVAIVVEDQPMGSDRGSSGCTEGIR